MSEQEHVKSAASEESSETASDETSAETSQQVSADPVHLDRVRDLVLSANPDVVREMVQGETFDDLLASVEPAREAYQRIAGKVSEQQSTPRVATQPGGRSTEIPDLDRLSPLTKIREGLRRGS